MQRRDKTLFNSELEKSEVVGKQPGGSLIHIVDASWKKKSCRNKTGVWYGKYSEWMDAAWLGTKMTSGRLSNGWNQ